MLRARWVFPIDHPPLPDGVVELHGEEVVSVRAYRRGDTVENLGDVALLPGLVNAHTHLEFSSLAQPLGAPRMAFPDWIRLVIDYRRELENRPGGSAPWRHEAVSQGIEQSQAAGVALLGEIATSSWSEAPINSADLTTVVFAELLGLSGERIEPLWEAAQRHVAAGRADGARWLPGLSPHAPYTVPIELLARVCEKSAEEQFPVAMHLAESLEEIELLLSGSGRLVELLQSLNAFAPGAIRRGSRPLDYLQLLAKVPRALVVHGNFLSSAEIEFAGQHSSAMSVVYCPRTHAYFCAGDYPLAEMLSSNINVCLGTDSRATNPDLRLFEEMRFVAQRHPAVSPEGVLHLGTQSGADALGLGHRFGSISPGKSPRLTVVRLMSTRAEDPLELLFEDGTSAGPLLATGLQPSPGDR